MQTKYNSRGAASVSAAIEIDGLREAVAVLRTFSKEMNAEARDASVKISERVARDARARAYVSSPQARLVAPSIRARRDRFPAVAAGGAKRAQVSRMKSKPSVGDLFFGAEFGGRGRSTTMQFRPHRGQQGYFFWPAIRANQEMMSGEWFDALDAIARRWAD